MKCNKCGNENPDNAVFCMYCGSPLPTQTTCPYCGGELDGVEKFCKHCGKELAPPSKKGWRNLIFHTFKWLTIWCVLCACYCQYSYKNFSISKNRVQLDDKETLAYRYDVKDKCFGCFKGSAIGYGYGLEAHGRAIDKYRWRIDDDRVLCLIFGGFSLLITFCFKFDKKRTQTNGKK